MQLASQAPKRYEFGPFHLDVDEHELRRGGQVVPLPGKAFELLVALVRQAGRTVTKGELLASLWPDTAVEESNLTQTMFLLRRALGDAGEESASIETVPRRGYKFVAPLVGVEPDPAEQEVSDAEQPVAKNYRWIWPAATSASLLLAAVVTVLWLRQPVPVDLSSYRYRAFTNSEEADFPGTWSPDGKAIAFLRGGARLIDPARLMVQAADSTRAVQVLARARFPVAWPADGSRIFFFGSDGIYAVSPAGGRPELVLAGVRYFDVSPEGKTLAVWKADRSQNGVRTSVWIASPPGAEPHEYLPAPFAVQGSSVPVFLHFSPNGKLLYLNRFSANGTTEAWLLPFPPGSGQPRRLFRNDSKIQTGNFSWMPDSRRAVLTSNLGLSLLDTQTESMTRLDDGSSSQGTPVLSPDGKRLLLNRTTISSDLFELPLDGTAPRKLLATSLPEFAPSWSRKGNEFAFLTIRNKGAELWVHSSQGDWDRPVVSPQELGGGRLHALEVSPDGTRVAYPVVNNNRGGIYVSPLVGGAPAAVGRGGGAPSWSPDGSSLVFLWTKPDGATVLATVRLSANQKPVEIADLPAPCFMPPLWSPSGEWIACGTSLNAINAQPVTPLLVTPDGKRKRLLKPMNAAILAWGADDRTLYGLEGRSGRLILTAQDLATGLVRNVADYGPGLNIYVGSVNFSQRMSLSPDGKSFAVGLSVGPAVQSSLWILEGFAK